MDIETDINLAKELVAACMGQSDCTELPLDFPNERVRQLVDEVSSVLGYRKDYLLVGLLMAVSAVVGKKISLKDREYVNYPSLWVVLLGAAEVNKTSPLQWALAPVEKLITKYAKQYQTALHAYNKKHDVNTPFPVCKELILKDTTHEKRLMTLCESESLL